MVKLRIILALLMVTVLVAASDYSEAATPITISQVGAGTYSISTVDLPEAAGMDLTVKYDADSLEAPQVKSGALIGAALMVPNTATAGYIRIGIVTGGVIKGTGELVSITFTARKKSAPMPTLSSSVYSAAGTQLAVDSSASATQTTTTGSSDGSKTTTGGAVTNSSSSTTVNTTSTGSTSSSSSSVVSQATIAGSQMIESGFGGTPARDDSRREQVREDVVTSYAATSSTGGSGNSSTVATGAVNAVVPVENNKVSQATLKSTQSVLNRFQAYKDVRTVKRLSTLFDDGAMRAAGITQSPAMVVSDGKSRLKITVDLSKSTDAPSFSLKGANQKSLKRVADGKWELEALPQKGKADVRLSVLLKGERIEIPLVVIPPLSQTFVREFDAMTEAGLDSLLAKPVKNNKPAYDLNSDAKQDYLDDYILVGHWLLKKQRSASGTAKKPAAAHK